MSDQERAMWIAAYCATLASGQHSAECCNDAANAAVKYARSAGVIQ